MALLQSIVKAVAEIDAVGAPAFGNTSTVDVATHPLDGSVAVNVYTPAAHACVTTVVCVPHTPVPQSTNALVGEDTLPVKVIEGDEHVKVWLLPADNVGATVFCVTAVVAVAVHPFVASNTVTEYPSGVLVTIVSLPWPMNADALDHV